MSETPKRKIEVTLASFPYVRWDRYVKDAGEITAYGWIDRQDAYKDFLILYFDKQGEVESFVTSSAPYSLSIYKQLNDGSGRGHMNCKRIESAFDIPNSIKL